MPLSTHGKRWIADAMYHRGKNFVAAAILLRQKGGYEYVVLHLLCQGLEIILKSFLIDKDFNKYRPKSLVKLGHDLVMVADEVQNVYGLRRPRPQVREELLKLNEYYKKHMLRYSKLHDIFIDPGTIESARMVRLAAACIRLAERTISPH